MAGLKRRTRLGRVVASGIVLAVAFLSMAASASAKKKPTPTGPRQLNCQTWVGSPYPSEACAFLWYDATTHQLSARLTLEYSSPGASTNIADVDIETRARTTPESVVAAISPGSVDTSMANQVYTFSTAEVALARRNEWRVKVSFQPSSGGTTGPVVTMETGWDKVKIRR